MNHETINQLRIEMENVNFQLNSVYPLQHDWKNNENHDKWKLQIRSLYILRRTWQPINRSQWMICLIVFLTLLNGVARHSKTNSSFAAWTRFYCGHDSKGLHSIHIIKRMRCIKPIHHLYIFRNHLNETHVSQFLLLLFLFNSYYFILFRFQYVRI